MLKYRILSGCIISAVFILVANYLPAPMIWPLMVAISSLAMLEFYTMMNKAGIPVFRVVGILCGAALITATFWTIGPEVVNVAAAYKWEQFVLLASLVIIFVRQFPQKNNAKPLETIGCTLLGIWYVPYLFNFFTRLAFMWDGVAPDKPVSQTGRLLVLYLVVVVKMGDIAAYCVGSMVGRHKVFPRISPGKTWEGVFGGVAGSMLASWIFVLVCGGRLGSIVVSGYDTIILGCLLSVVGVVGDMFESLLKRAAGAKDSSAVIPGMGGILDVLDSLLFGAPVLYFYARMLLT